MNRLTAGCRVAFAALLHDLGKFAQRAGLTFPRDKLEGHLHTYCPSRGDRFTHHHAAYTALAWDELEKFFPKDLHGEPFGGERDNSLVNAAAKHHTPETFLQWVVATADRVASGFERESFERYNLTDEGTKTKKNHYTARLLTLFERIHLSDRRETLNWRYPLKPLAPENLFPVLAQGYETDDVAKAKEEYRTLWEQFVEALEKIPPSHRESLPLWLDHFDSLWLTFTHAIPSATAFGLIPDVSLYDHSRTVAALAVALWRYHHDQNHDPESLRRRLESCDDWDENKFLLILGDFFGIQDFIFASGGETQKHAAKLLRGRSFYVSLLTECAALKVLETLELPPTSQVISAAGKFLIVAPNTEETRGKLTKLQEETFDQWFLKHTFGVSGIGLAWQKASCNDFVLKYPFTKLRESLFEKLDHRKAQKFTLWKRDQATLAWKITEKGVCSVCGQRPAQKEWKEAEAVVCPLDHDQVQIGKWLPRNERLLITTRKGNFNTLDVEIFGYWVGFTGGEEESGRFGPMVREGTLKRVWDYRFPEKKDEILFNGYARRFINAYVPRFGELTKLDEGRYEGITIGEIWDPDAPKTFEHLQRDNLIADRETDRFIGTEALMFLKGDVDNLGAIFQKGLERPTFARWAALSRQMNAFFAIYLPALCRENFPNLYTVFAGGDDFFMIGPWFDTLKFARRMREDFHRYVAENPEIHFSAGMLMTREGPPIRLLAEMTEKALEEAKDSTKNPHKNAVTIFRQTCGWSSFDELWQKYEALEDFREFELSTSYLYRLLELIDMRESVDERPENARWRSLFLYNTWRLLEQRESNEERRRRLMESLDRLLGEPMKANGAKFKIPLFIYLYRHRSWRNG